MFVSAKGKQQSRFASCSTETAPFGITACTYFPTTFFEQEVQHVLKLI